MQPGTLGRYKLLKEIGRGAMGAVYLAHDPEIDRNVAIKTVRFLEALPERERAEARERFLREARSAGKLIHPGIVTLFDVGEAEGALYLAMELVEGITLDAFCKSDNLLPLRTVIEMIAGIAETLGHAHRSGIVHRDIKPANLMRVGDVAAKIMDFGLAQPGQAQLTHDGAILGTPSYMSPEQIRGQPVDARSDLFSLAVVLFELLTGGRPFPGDSISSIIYRIVNEPPREASSVHRRAQPAFDGFLQRALSKEPAARFPDGQTFAAELRKVGGILTADEAQAAAPGAPEMLGTPPPRSASPRSSPTPYIVTALVLVTGLAVGGYYFRERLGLGWLGQAEEIWWEAQVRTEPAGIEVLLDDAPLPPGSEGVVKFQPAGPFGKLSASLDCRTAEHQIGPEDAGTEVVLVVDPVEIPWQVDPGVDEVAVMLNGDAMGNAPLDLALNLCQENRLGLRAAGFEPAVVEIPAGATPLDARTLLAGLTLVEIPKGRLVLPSSVIKLVYYVDDQRVSDLELDLPEGEYEVRIKNETYWIDVRQKVRVVGGETVKSPIRPPALANLVVQAFPANCKLYLRKPGGSWKYVDDTPSRRRIAAGKYQVRVTLNPTGESRERDVELTPGDNPPVRIAFASGR